MVNRMAVFASLTKGPGVIAAFGAEHRRLCRRGGGGDELDRATARRCTNRAMPTRRARGVALCIRRYPVKSRPCRSAATSETVLQKALTIGDSGWSLE